VPIPNARFREPGAQAQGTRLAAGAVFEAGIRSLTLSVSESAAVSVAVAGSESVGSVKLLVSGLLKVPKGGLDMELETKLCEELMKLVVRISDVVTLAKRFEETPTVAMREVVQYAREAMKDVLEKVMDTEIELFLGNPEQEGNKRNGYVQRSFSIKGVGTVSLRVPRDRLAKFSSHVVPARRRYDEATERDLALLNLAGLSTRMLAQLSRGVLGVPVSAQEVSNSLRVIVPAAKQFLERPLGDRQWIYLYVDGTSFRVRRTTVDREPTLVVLGVDEDGCKSVLSMVQGDKDNRRAWAVVFAELKVRGLDPTCVQLGIMDGLPGLEEAFLEAFPRSKTARCWVHKARNVFVRVPRRYQAAFQVNWDAVQYADSLAAADTAYATLKATWTKNARDAVACIEKDLPSLLAHYDFPPEHWNALRTTNPIERVNKEFKRRSKAMEVVSTEGLKVLLAFTALKLEFGWSQTPITSGKLGSLKWRHLREAKQLETITESLLH
jgi:putative transposase